MQITVVRGKGDNQGDNIIDELLCSDVAARQRGEAEIERSTPKMEETAQGPAKMFETGLHFRVGDTEEQWDGQLIWCQRVLEMSGDGFNFSASCGMRFVRPL